MKYKSLIKVGISALMLTLVLRTAKLSSLEHTFKSIPLTSLFIVVVAYSCGQLLSSYKWCTIANAAGVKTSYPRALRAYFIGMFLNCFGLGTVGGDVARGVIISQGSEKKAAALASVVADRLHGLAVLSAIGTVSAVFFGYNTIDGRLLLLLVLLGIGIVVCWFLGPVVALTLLPAEGTLRAKFKNIFDAFPRRPATLVKITAVALVFHLVQIALHRVMGNAVGVTIPWRFLLVTIPFVNIVSTLPISWNGLGVRENAYSFFLVPAILKPEDAVVFGAMWLLAVTVSSAIGGLIAVVTNDFSKLAQAEKKDPGLSDAEAIIDLTAKS